MSATTLSSGQSLAKSFLSRQRDLSKFLKTIPNWESFIKEFNAGQAYIAAHAKNADELRAAALSVKESLRVTIAREISRLESCPTGHQTPAWKFLTPGVRVSFVADTTTIGKAKVKSGTFTAATETGGWTLKVEEEEPATEEESATEEEPATEEESATEEEPATEEESDLIAKLQARIVELENENARLINLINTSKSIKVLRTHMAA